MAERGRWTEEAVRSLLAEGHFGYQKIQLPYGLSTGGRDRSPTARAIFPEDMTGKSVLDIGSKFGFFCFEAARRGASRVLGVDVDPRVVGRARLLADCLGADVSFEALDVEAVPITERFDYVLCLNVLHHIRDPISLLDKLTAITRERLVLEVAGFSKHDRKKAGISRLRAAVLERSPVIWITPNSAAESDTQQSFLSPAAIENLLFRKRKNFARVEIRPSEQKRRFIAIAEKRRIGDLLVIAGPAGSELPELVRQLRAGLVPEVQEKTGVDPSRCVFVRAGELDRLTEPVVEHLVLEYDFTRPLFRSAQIHARDDALDPLREAENVRFLTLWCPPARLLARMREQRFPRWRTSRSRHFAERHAKLLKEFERPSSVCAVYRRWFEFTSTVTGRDDLPHAIISLEDGIKWFSPAEWEALAVEAEAGHPAAGPAHSVRQP